MQYNIKQKVMLNIILFGPPGSGKGTQSENLIEKYGLNHISTGDILRAEIKNETELGKEAKGYIDAGKLVPDETVINMLAKKVDEGLGNNAKGFIFDGFPRTIPQAEALDDMMETKNLEIDCLLALEVGKEELVKRILNRGKTSGRSDDTDEGIIQQRVEEYENKTAPIADYYGKQGKLKTIKGEGSIEDTFDLLCDAIKQGVSSN